MYSLFTAIQLRDIPSLMRTVAHCYERTANEPSNNQKWDELGKPDRRLWLAAAEKMRTAAAELTVELEWAQGQRVRMRRREEPKPERVRMKR